MNGQEILPYTAKFKFQAKTVRLLIDYGADVTAQDETHRTPLHLAAFSGSTETVQLLIEHGADVTAQDRGKKTPLHLLSSDVSFVSVSLLILQCLTQMDSIFATYLEITMRMRTPRKSKMSGY